MPETIALGRLKGEPRANGQPSGGADPVRHPERVVMTTYLPRSRPYRMPETIPSFRLKDEKIGNEHPAGEDDPVRHPSE